MNFSPKESPQFGMLSLAAQEAIMRDSGETGNADPTLAFDPDKQLASSVRGPVFADSPAELGGKGALSAIPAIKAPTTPKQGALSAVHRPPMNLQAMIDQFAPRDDSASKYFAIAAALGKPTGFGTLGEKFGNIAQALNEQKEKQEKLRSQYIPIIMQQVAAQQAREEQAAYRMELSQQTQHAAMEAQRERLAQQSMLAAQARDAKAEADQRHADLMKTLSGNKPPPTPTRQVDNEGRVWMIDHYGKPTMVTDATGKPILDKDFLPSGGASSTGGAPVLGVPTPRALPWATQSNPKDADKVKALERSRGAKEIEKDDDAAKAEAATAQMMTQFMALNAKRPTGELMDKVPGGQWAQSFNKDYATMQSISAEIVPKMRPVGSGSSSDLDVKMFTRATIGVDKPKETNDNIARAVIQRAQTARDYADFRSTYLEQNGTLQGANQHWNKYLQDNPVFDPNATSDFKLNQNRQKWTEYFTASVKPAASAESDNSTTDLVNKWKSK